MISNWLVHWGYFVEDDSGDSDKMLGYFLGGDNK